MERVRALWANLLKGRLERLQLFTQLYGCVEAGGTKFVVGVARGRDRVGRVERIPTTTPDETLAAAVRVLEEEGPVAAVGVAGFSPLVLDRGRPDWGRLADTPKPGWSGADLAGPFARALRCPVALDTDVNGAALAESLWGAAEGAGVAVYVTVGTGVSGGAVVDGRPVHGARHPVMGHFRPVRHRADDFAGVCPFHGACLEGLVSGTAIRARWGAPLSDLGPTHEAHDVVAFYLGQLVAATQAMLSPERVVFGGGVMATPGLLDRVRDQAARLANGYFGIAAAEYGRLVVPARLGDRAGLLGALALAQQL